MTEPSIPAPIGDAAFWDLRYRERPWTTDPDPLIAETLDGLAAGRALDLGCGTGRHAIWLAQRGWSVTGVDASAVGLKIAAERAVHEQVLLTLVQADILGFAAPSEGFDLVVLANVHPGAADRCPVLARAADAVAPGGHLLLIGHHVDNLGRSGPPDPARLYTVQRIRDALPVGLEVHRLERVERHGTGPGDAPDAAVIAWLRRPSPRGLMAAPVLKGDLLRAVEPARHLAARDHPMSKVQASPHIAAERGGWDGAYYVVTVGRPDCTHAAMPPLRS